MRISVRDVLRQLRTTIEDQSAAPSRRNCRSRRSPNVRALNSSLRKSRHSIGALDLEGMSAQSVVHLFSEACSKLPLSPAILEVPPSTASSSCQFHGPVYALGLRPLPPPKLERPLYSRALADSCVLR
jgi:hypothetical protein